MRERTGTAGPTVADALRTLELSEARWQAVLASARDAIISIDHRGRITLFNQAAEQIFGYGAGEVLGKNVKMLMPPPYAEQHDRYIETYRKTGRPQAIGRIREVEARRKNGEVFPIELSVSEARVGRQVLCSAIIRDVSERRRAQAQLVELQKAAQQRERLADIGAITAKIVHDLGNPLSGLSMQAQLILRRVERGQIGPAAAVRDPAGRIVSTVRRLEHLVREFMAFAREQRLECKDVLLPEFLQDVVGLWQPVAAARAIDLSLDADNIRIRADEVQLRRVFDNLLKNAIEAIERGPARVDISVGAAAEKRVRISIADTGPGFPETMEGFRLFETTKPNGTGLGLAVAKQIILAHGGDIELARLLPHGTVFHIDLPRHGPAA
jgi:two-component system sensor kinase FixL